MANLVFNVAAGRVAEFVNRVQSNDPANSALIAVLIDANGVSDATFRDYDTLSALLGGSANEITNSGYSRIVLTNADLSAISPDDTNDRMDVDIPDLEFGAISAGDAITDVLICYDGDTTGGSDSNITPLTLHDFAVTADGSEVTAQINAAGFYRATPS